ncbi:MAG: beta-galactosidase [Rhodobacteraceae bacterium]|nr:beta-galactosidase [Paracoccaceae bacterium]
MTGRALGVCYYPEHWPESWWEEDAARMVAAGITWVRIGEFAWSRLEPVSGDLRLDWLDRAIATLGAAGLKIVLGTPTAAPPRWMLDRHPDMLARGKTGQLRKFGSRRHYDFSHKGYREECARITEILARRYSNSPYLGAWQVDNEFGCHDTVLSYSSAALIGFRAWLATKYKDIGDLNAAWGNVFWSMEYGEFDQIDFPNGTVTEANPSHWLDFHRFSSEQVAAFSRRQAEIIRRYSNLPILHNYMGRITDFDHFAVGAELDAASWDSYPLGFLEDRSDAANSWKADFARQGDPDFQAFHHDLYRAVGRGRWWVMEQQPGPVNWAPYNPAPLTGMVRLWTWEALAHGAEIVIYFRWRQAPFAQEQMHAGLLTPDSREAPGLAEATQVARELASGPEIEGPPLASVALVFDYQSAWAWSIQPQGADFNYFRLVFEVYRGLRLNGLTIDILSPDVEDLSRYSLVVVPGLLAWTTGLRTALSGYHGHAIIGPRTGSKTEHFGIPASMPPDLLALETRVAHVESLRPDCSLPLEGGGHFYIWREITDGSSFIVERTVDGVAAMRRQGRLSYLCGWPDRVAMRRLLGEIAQGAGIRTTPLPDGLRRVETPGEVFWFNYAAEPVALAAVVGDSSLPEVLGPADFHRGARTESR